MNILNKDDQEKFNTNFFQSNGYKTLETYLKTLIEFYLTKTEYPFNYPLILGIPYFSYSHEVKTEDELIGRIKILGQLLGLDKIIFEDNNKEIEFYFDGSFSVTEK
jgi:hypothetical protein